MDDPWRCGGASALVAHAPLVHGAIRRLAAAWPDVLSEGRLAMIRTVTAEGLGLTALRGPQVRAPEPPEPEVMAFAEQFAVDVARIDDELRADFRRALGSDALTAAQATYVADVVPRVRSALEALFGRDLWIEGALGLTARTGTLLDELMGEIARLRSLDVVTSELVRLRCARAHQCRLSMSWRSLDAVEAGADAALFDQVDHYRTSTLSAPQRAALALTDAVVWTPADLRERDLAAVRENLTPAQAVEVVLDVASASAAKILVALGTDAPRDTGVRLFSHDDAGRHVFP